MMSECDECGQPCMEANLTPIQAGRAISHMCPACLESYIDFTGYGEGESGL